MHFNYFSTRVFIVTFFRLAEQTELLSWLVELVGGGGKRDGAGRGVTSVSLCTDTDDRVTLGEDAASHA